MILSGVLFNACGPMPDITVKLEAQRTTMNGVVYSAECYFTTQEDGSYYIELEPGYYTVSWIERGRPVRLGSIVADIGSEMSLPEALEADFTPAEPSYVEDAIAQMQAALADAEQRIGSSQELIEARDAAADSAADASDSAQEAASSAQSAEDNAQATEQDRIATEDNRTAVEASASQAASDAAAAVAAKTAAEAARDQAQAISDPEAAIEANFDIWIKDKEREQFEAATGGACTIERTADGDAAHMFIIPRLRWEDLVPSGELGTGVHEAFIEDGVEKSELLIGMYQAASMTGSGASSTRLTSQPGLVPRRSINWDNSRSEAQATGFDMMSNWEWSALAMWCMANGYQPRGNTNSGKSHSHPHERGIINDSVDNTDTGTGPNTWNHNNAANGIADLVGNVWEWVWGFKLMDGRVMLAPDNDKSLVESSWVDTGWDMPSASSSNWANFYNSENEAPLDVRRALIMPNGVADPDGSMWTNLEGERFPRRGGSRHIGAAAAGLGALLLSSERTYAATSNGLRFSRLV